MREATEPYMRDNFFVVWAPEQNWWKGDAAKWLVEDYANLDYGRRKFDSYEECLVFILRRYEGRSPQEVLEDRRSEVPFGAGPGGVGQDLKDAYEGRGGWR